MVSEEINVRLKSFKISESGLGSLNIGDESE